MLSWHAQTHHFLDHCLRVPFFFSRCYFSLNSVNAFSKFVQWLSLSVSLDGYLLNKIYSLHVIYVALHKQQQTKIFLVTAKRSLPFTNVTELKVFADINKLEVNTSFGVICVRLFCCDSFIFGSMCTICALR